MVVIETSVFTKQVQNLLSAEEYRQMQSELITRPEMGVVIPHSSGLRKIRWSAKGHGKRGGACDLLLGGCTGSTPSAAGIPKECAG